MGRRGDEDATDTDAIFQEGDPMKSVRFYHWMLYDMRFRIVYTTILAVLLGIGVPILFYVFFHSTPTPNYGSCLISTDFRFECLINEGRAPTEDECIEAMCCYEDDDTLPFKCHHSFTPAYQYEVIQVDKALNLALPETDIVHLRLQPKYQSAERPTLTELNVSLAWVDAQHFTIHIYDPAKVNRPSNPTNGRGMEANTKAEDIGGDLPFDVSYSAQSEFFFVHLQRNLTKETIFDTRLGPVISDDNSLSFTTMLPTPYFFGLTGGQGNGHMRSNVINAPGTHDLPFYISFEASGQSHGLLLETFSPFIFDSIGAPAALFHLEGPNAQATLHFFVGPTPIDVYQQLHNYLTEIRENDEVDNESWMPPYWSLGLHLCRKNFNATETYEELRQLNGINEGTDNPPIPYDSDCIDENLRTPFEIDPQKYPPTSAEFRLILDHLNNENRRILLEQKIGLDVNVYGNGSELPNTPLIQHRDSTPLVGLSKRGTEDADSTFILYPDYLSRGALEWAESEMEPILTHFTPHMLSGLVLGDSFPLVGSSRQVCEQPRLTSRLRSLFYDLNLVCPDALHTNASISSSGVWEEVSHLDGHNAYGQEAMQTLKTALRTILNSTSSSNERILVAGASVWTKSSLGGAFTGLQVPFTWRGLTDSLAHLLRNFMLLPFAGIPICGSYLADDPLDSPTTSLQNGDDLCLRWFQLALLLPFARNTHEANVIRGPLDMPLKYRNYIIGNIRSRYKYNPYYYTAFYESHLQPKPLIRPLAFDFNQNLDWNATVSILSQFMIGPALMVAPILSAVTTREAYFPTGTWYDVHGNVVASHTNGGRVLTIPSLFSEIPMFIRSGHIIPTLNAELGRNAAETRAGNYTLIATFPTEESPLSKGSLFVDDGVSKNSISEGDFDYVTFEGTAANFSIHAECQFTGAATGISKTIEEIKIFGFPNPGAVVRIVTSPPLNHAFAFGAGAADDETTSLEMLDLRVNWCEIPSLTFTWLYE